MTVNDSTFLSIWTLVEHWGWVDDDSCKSVRCACKALAGSRLALPYPLAPYVDPLLYRYRGRKGFGGRSTERSSSYTSPSPFFLIHLAWDYLDCADRGRVLQTTAALRDYGRLRRDASLKRNEVRNFMLARRRPPAAEPALCPFRTWISGAALLNFDLDYGDLIRWLGGEYTNQHRDWAELATAMAAARQFQQRPGYPTIEFDRALEGCMTGVPLKGHYECSYSDTAARIEYDNHPPLQSSLPAVREKFAKEEAKTFHMTLPRFLAYFLLGLMISPITWVVRKGKGRIAIDATSRLHPADGGAVNDQIPPPGTEGRERENPAVYYGQALRRHLEAIWNLRIDHPSTDLLQHSDDIEAAFRRMLYHPDLAVAFAYVFMELLIIPIGMIFGARNSPSFWCEPAELRAHMAAVNDYSDMDTPLADDLKLPPPPTAAEAATFVAAVPDQFHAGVPAVEGPTPVERSHHAMFVDDNIAVAVRDKIVGAVQDSEGSAYICFGRPEADRRSAPLVPEKWEPIASFEVEHLGYNINTRTMRVSWPDDKQRSLHELLQDWLDRPRAQSPAAIAKVLGYIRNGAFLCPAGTFLSLRLQWVLTDAIRSSNRQATNRRWWKFHSIRIPREVFSDLRLLFHSLTETGPTAPTIWSRPIGLLIRREYTAAIYSDAAYSGIGGWSPHFRYMWRLSHQNLVDLGFPMRDIDKDGEDQRRWCKAQDLPDDHWEMLHINPLEFIGIIINIWFAVWSIRKDPDKLGGHIINVLADNTSALSWLKYAARTRRPLIRNLAYLLHGILIYSQTSDIAKFVGNHIAGILNVEADRLSRFEQWPTLDSVTEPCSQLQTCQAYRIPYGLVSTIKRFLSLPSIEATHVQQMIDLSILEPRTLEDGWSAKESIQWYFQRHPRRQPNES